jgi:hypothetical protein
MDGFFHGPKPNLSISNPRTGFVVCSACTCFSDRAVENFGYLCIHNCYGLYFFAEMSNVCLFLEI